ncbi:MAG: [Fe-Fe] hydrogenase large subunit C-terminal domain-containing protein [Clostridia bacterium]|nr:[Fe-Fe] hydrogenase large subunit C-terminal domain-containing protein [Clostridia bacterium]
MGLINTIKANCKDCYKCVRYCPMKAIRVAGGHAEVVDELCIGDGKCVQVCPQGAKQVRSSVEAVRGILASPRPAVLSIAPSFVASFDLPDPGCLAAACRRLGFEAVVETAEAAHYVAMRCFEVVDACARPAIASSCPVAVNLIERYHPELIPNLIPVASPMIAHGRMLKMRYGSGTEVVFAGPCIAKKDEAARAETAGAVDAVLTFSELACLFEEAGISPACEAPDQWNGAAPGEARLYPIEGGMMAAAGRSTDALARADLVITGIENCMEALAHISEHSDVRLIDMLSCPGGCIAGPSITSTMDVWSRRRVVMEHADRGFAGEAAPPGDVCDRQASTAVDTGSEDEPPRRDAVPAELLEASFTPRQVSLPQPSEADIRRILAQTDKLTAQDELNCGACGYNSCRDKAVAVFRGMAELEMCIPYMRARAESLSAQIINSTPVGIVVVDRGLNIVSVNPAFESIFRLHGDECLGQRVDVAMDPGQFKRVFDSMEPVNEYEVHLNGALRTSQNIFYVGVRDVAVAIVTDVTADFHRQQAIARAREETLTKAGTVIERQMRVAQEIAGLLGETTAETKVLLTQLIRQMQNEELTR